MHLQSLNTYIKSYITSINICFFHWIGWREHLWFSHGFVHGFPIQHRPFPRVFPARGPRGPADLRPWLRLLSRWPTWHLGWNQSISIHRYDSIHRHWWLFGQHLRPLWQFLEIGLPPNHLFIDGNFQEINHPAMGVPPWLWKPPCVHRNFMLCLSWVYPPILPI